MRIAVGMDGLAPSQMAYSSSQQRLYLGYSTGAIQYIDATAPTAAEVPFAHTRRWPSNGLAAVGNFLLAQDGSGAWATHYIFNAAGAITDQADWNYYSREYAWDPVTSRVYFFRDDFSPNDLHYEVIDQATGQITVAGRDAVSRLLQHPAADPRVRRTASTCCSAAAIIYNAVRPDLGRLARARRSRMHAGLPTARWSR